MSERVLGTQFLPSLQLRCTDFRHTDKSSGKVATEADFCWSQVEDVNTEDVSCSLSLSSTEDVCKSRLQSLATLYPAPVTRGIVAERRHDVQLTGRRLTSAAA